MNVARDDLPEEFEYLRKPLDLCKDANITAGRGGISLMKDFSVEQLDILATAYREITRREDMSPISKWYNSGSKMSSASSRRGDLFRMMFVFRHYHDRGVPPFSDRLLEIDYPKRVPNWDNVPAELQFLREPAEKYGIYQFDDERADFVERMTPEEREELRDVYRRLEDEHVAELFDIWCKTYKITDHEEAALVYFMFGVMDYADIS